MSLDSGISESGTITDGDWIELSWGRDGTPISRYTFPRSTHILVPQVWQPGVGAGEGHCIRATQFSSGCCPNHALKHGQGQSNEQSNLFHLRCVELCNFEASQRLRDQTSGPHLDEKSRICTAVTISERHQVSRRSRFRKVLPMPSEVLHRLTMWHGSSEALLFLPAWRFGTWHVPSCSKQQNWLRQCECCVLSYLNVSYVSYLLLDYILANFASLSL